MFTKLNAFPDLLKDMGDIMVVEISCTRSLTASIQNFNNKLRHTCHNCNYLENLITSLTSPNSLFAFLVNTWQLHELIVDKKYLYLISTFLASYQGATDQDIMESPQHASFPMLQHKKELESLNLYLAANEFAHMKAEYLEGALLAFADSTVTGLK
ncbi:MAG: hypothetical protein DRQ43_05620 [Gammaproteobacteria bacterium]|nr:MAG: hypothetical protein DRQ43_05620 [Gammaproteobacteria bacterium]